MREGAEARTAKGVIEPLVRVVARVWPIVIGVRREGRTIEAVCWAACGAQVVCLLGRARRPDRLGADVDVSVLADHVHRPREVILRAALLDAVGAHFFRLMYQVVRAISASTLLGGMKWRKGFA